MRPLGFQPLFAFLLALAPALESRAVHAAQEPSPTELSVARRLFDEGRAAEDAGRWHEAAEKFLRATGIKDTPGLRFHLARCEEEQGAFVEALVEYDRARELIESGFRAPDVEKLLPEARDKVRAKVAQLTLRLPPGVANVSVELDGKALSASVLGVSMPINPGKHRLKAVAVGRTPFNDDLELAKGEVKQLAIELPVSATVPAASPLPAAPAPNVETLAPQSSTPPTDSSGSGRTVVLVGEATLFAAGVVTGVVGLVDHSAANRDYAKYNQLVLDEVGGSDPNGTACASPRPYCAALDQTRKDRTSATTLSVIGFATAGGSAAAFGLTLGLWHASTPVKVGASAAPGQFALSVSGRF